MLGKQEVVADKSPLEALAVEVSREMVIDLLDELASALCPRRNWPRSSNA
jgi:hypothetical protein